MIRFYDTTLRDGEQMPGLAFTRAQRVRIAEALDAAGVDEIEVGFAAAGPSHRADMAAVTALGLRVRTLSLARPLAADIDAAHAAGVGGVIVFAPVSDILLQHKMRRSLEEVFAATAEAVAYARRRGLYTQVALEDATRAPDERVVRLAGQMRDAGAQRVSLADTVGLATPSRLARLVAAVVAAVDIAVAVHCHDDFGLATANTLAAVEAGATVVSSTFNGVGERAGNTATEQCAAAIVLLLGRPVSIDLSQLHRVARLVSELSGVPIQPHRPIVGENAFRHESGIHVAAMLRHSACYEPFDPAIVGGVRQIVAGKTSGRAALRHLAGAAAEALDDATCARVLERLKVLAEARVVIDGPVLVRVIAECS